MICSHQYKLQLTTLRGRDLEDRQHTYEYQYNHEFYLAIHPTEPPCPYLYPQLRLEHDLQLRKPGYLSIRKRYTIPLEMLEPYNRKRPNLRYQLTAESFATVAKTFSMKVPRPIRSSCDGDSSTQSLCNVPQKPAAEERKPAMTHSEPDLGSEGAPLAKIKLSAMPQSESERGSRITPTSYILANPPSTCMQSIQENDATCTGPLLTSGGFKAMVLAGITDAALTTAEKSREFMDAFRTRFYKTEA